MSYFRNYFVRAAMPAQHALAKLALPLITATSLVVASSALAQQSPPVQGGTIQYGHEQEPPCLIGVWVQEWYLQRQFSDNLVAKTVEGKIVPWLATSWTVSKDNKIYTFQIKPNVKFTDGTPLDAQAIADNIQGWLSSDADRKNVAAQLYFGKQLKSVEATGPLTLRLELNTPYQPLLSVLSQSVHGILSPTQLKKGLKVNCESPVGSGPFIVEKWNHGQNIIFKRNPNYNSAPANAKHQGPAYVEGIVWKFLGQPTVRYGSLTSGESDVIYDIPAVNWDEAKARYKIEQHITGGSPLRFQLNSTSPTFQDVNVRRAFAYASNRKAAVEASYLGSVPFEGNPALTSSSPEYVKELANSYAYDKAKANKLLDAAGWTERNAQGVRVRNGLPLVVRVVYSGSFVNPDGVQALQIVQQQAKEVGFDVQLKPITTADWFAGRHRGVKDYEIIVGYWVASSAEIFRLSWRPDEPGFFNGNNMTRLQDADLWKLVEQADQTFDEKTRTGIYKQIQRRITENAGVVGFTVLPVTLAINPRLKDVWLSRGSVGEPVFHDAYFTE